MTVTQSDDSFQKKPDVLITGATGYVGGRLLRKLEGEGHRVRCLARRPELLKAKVARGTEVVKGDLLVPPSLDAALDGIDTAYYLVHSMDSPGDFEEKDRRAARSFADAARKASIRRIIYLGGLGDDGQALSSHLRSRHEVGEILRTSGSQVIEFRASIVIGPGSLSFEMIRALVERLPVMVTPRWVSSLAQPIAIDDLIDYLRAALDLPIGENRIFEIGGLDTVSYKDCMRVYANQRRLRRLMIPVPVLTPWLSSLWLRLVTPLYAPVGRKLIESIINPTVVRNAEALELFDIRPKGIDEAISRALRDEERELAETRWSDVFTSSDSGVAKDISTYGTCFVESYSIRVPYPPSQAFEPVLRIGGNSGWYFANWLWRLRGLIDFLVRGVGPRRGRSNTNELAPGDKVDFWRVEAFEPNRLLRLEAEMKLPGRAWLQFEVDVGEEGSLIRQTALFDPLGLFGLAYWYLLSPIHKVIFAGMIKGIAKEVGRMAGQPSRVG